MPFIKRLDAFAILSVIFPLAVYLLTLAPSVTFFDSGEFITATACLGSAHSPGYPFFLNYAKPFTWIPLSSVAFKVNFATAVSGALACFGVYLLTTCILRKERLAGNDSLNELLAKGAALAACLTFTFSPRLWLQSNHDKPYPLLAFIVAIILYLILQWRESYREGSERPSYIFISSFLCGLATGTHQTIILMIPAFAYLIISMNWQIVFRIRDLVVAAIFGILGFAINLHLPIRATRAPLLNWANPQTRDQFLWHFLRKGYPGEHVERGWTLLWKQINAFNIPHEFTSVGLFIMIIGLAFIVIKRRDEVISYLLALATFLLVIAGYFNTPEETIFLTEEFFTPMYLFSAVFMGIGLFFLTGKTVEKLRLIPNLQMAKTVTTVLLLALPTTVCSLNYVKNDQHLNYIAFDYGTNVIRSAPQGAALYTWGDSGAFPIWYIQGVERMREDLDILHTPHLIFDWYLDAFPRTFTNSILRRIPLESLSPENALLLAAGEQYATRPVLIDYSTRYSVPFSGYKLIQHGITYQLIEDGSKMGQAPNLSVWDIYAMRDLGGKEMFFRDLDTGKAIMIYANSKLEIGEDLLRQGRLGDGLQSLRTAAQISPELTAEITQILSRYGVR